MRLHGVWVDTVVEKPTIWRCRCGAMLSTQKAMMRHVAGDTMCQHRGEGMVAYVPESFGPEAPGAGSEGAIPKQLAVPSEPQEENREHVETALAELNGLKDADLGRYERECLEAAEGALRRALSAVPLLQDGNDDV